MPPVALALNGAAPGEHLSLLDPTKQNPAGSGIGAYISGLATRLSQSLQRNGGQLDAKNWSMIEEMLNYAAEAEQQISDQKSRISFLESLSVTDELCKLANRRGFKEFLNRTLADSRRHNEHGILCMIDLNGFKKINDSLGHAAGDCVLESVAQILTECVRSGDFVSRLGGDEFAIVLTRTNPKAGLLRIRDIHRIINSSSADFNGLQIPISASLGSEVFGPHTDASELMKRADQAMYLEKNARKAQLEKH